MPSLELTVHVGELPGRPKALLLPEGPFAIAYTLGFRCSTIKKPTTGCNGARKQPLAIKDEEQGPAMHVTLCASSVCDRRQNRAIEPLSPQWITCFNTGINRNLKENCLPLSSSRGSGGQQPAFIPFLKQKNMIDENAELLSQAAVVFLHFALCGNASTRASC
jgi:hypothetical protein